MAYTLQLDELERRIATRTQAVLLAQASGAEVELPDPVAVREEFDAWLASEPERVDVDPVKATLMRALGLRRKG